MYENISYEMIVQRMLDQVLEKNPNLDTREGSIIFDAIAPAAIELKQLYMELDMVLNETFADTATREMLIRRASERGVRPQQATKAILKGVFSMDVPIGSRYSQEKLNYSVVEKIDTNTYTLECESFGVVGNLNFGTLIPINYIKGLETATLAELLIPGENEEETEALRKRYFSTLNTEAFGGNVTDYIEKTNALPGVGGVKVYPVWNGGGSVKLVMIDSEYSVPSQTLVSSVQSEIDPVSNSGTGKGIAPIGHVVTVEGVQPFIISIASNITFLENWIWEDVREKAEVIIDDYFKELSKEWAGDESIIVRISQIEIRLLGVAGIVDIGSTLLNGLEDNLILGSNEIPLRGEVDG